MVMVASILVKATHSDLLIDAYLHLTSDAVINTHLIVAMIQHTTTTKRGMPIEKST